MACRICLEEDAPLVSPCACKGSSGYIHEHCLNKWIETSGSNTCEICHEEYAKEAIWSFEPSKYCKSLFVCNLRNSHPLSWRLSLIWFGATCIMYTVIPYDQMILMNVCFTLTMCTVAIMMQLNLEEDMQIHNVLFQWKIAFSIPFAMICMLYILTVEEQCDVSCLSIGKICGGGCPYITMFNNKKTQLNYALYFDIVNIMIFVVIRSTLLCFTQMRRFRYKTLSEEEISLLVDEEYGVNSSSSGTSTGGSSAARFSSPKSSPLATSLAERNSSTDISI
jgi:hypothetical protein